MASDASHVHADVRRGRQHYARRRWADAVEALLGAQRRVGLQREDLQRLAWSAALVGDDDTFVAVLEDHYRACLETEDTAGAAMTAFWIGFRLLSIGTSGRAKGWLARARRHAGEADEACAERGYVSLPAIFEHFANGEDAAARDVARDVAEIGRRCSDADLVALAGHLEGRALLRLGRVPAGLALLDEVMVSVVADELSPLVTGLVYCNVITTCQEVFAFDRAAEWTAALADWCEQQPQLVTFTGNCRVYRSEILTLQGAWPDALEEVREIHQRAFPGADPELFADACYRRAELFRLRGETSDAEAAYHLAHRNGRDPHPGLALLRLTQGRTNEAVHAIERVMSTTKPTWKRARILPAYLEIMLAAGSVGEAATAADELERVAHEIGTEVLGAMAGHARGSVLLAEGDPGGAIEALREAFRVWHRVGAPYVTARIRVLLAKAYRALGDHDSARLEVEAARRTFEHLGARADVSALAATTGSERPAPHGLSPRELEVLRQVAHGKTNKEVATELGLSQRTIDRHVSNIFTKVGVSTRAAATAFAHREKLV